MLFKVLANIPKNKSIFSEKPSRLETAFYFFQLTYESPHRYGMTGCGQNDDGAGQLYFRMCAAPTGGSD